MFFAFENKLGAAKHFAERVVETGKNYDLSTLIQVKEIIAGVDHMSESLTNAKQRVDNFVNSN